MSTFRDRFLVAMDNKACADGFRKFITKCKHFLEFISGIDMKKREGDRSGVKSLACQMNEDAGILADGIKQNGVAKLSDDFADDIDRFRLKRFKVGPVFGDDAIFHGCGFTCSP